MYLLSADPLEPSWVSTSINHSDQFPDRKDAYKRKIIRKKWCQGVRLHRAILKAVIGNSLEKESHFQKYLAGDWINHLPIKLFPKPVGRKKRIFHRGNSVLFFALLLINKYWYYWSYFTHYAFIFKTHQGCWIVDYVSSQAHLNHTGSCLYYLPDSRVIFQKSMPCKVRQAQLNTKL